MADKKNSKRKSVAKSQFMHLYGAKLRSEVLATVDKSNTTSQPERRVSAASAIEVANRSLAKTATYSSDVRYFSAIRSVNAFIALATRNKQTPQALSNADLLPIGHPSTTRSHAMTASALRHAQARWIAADPMIDESVRALVASAHAARPGSTERAHAFARLSVAGIGKVPIYATIDELSIDPIVAALGLGLGGNSSAARRLRAQLQRRDRRGRFAFMGGGWSFNLRLPDGLFKAVSGRVVGQSGDDGVEIEVIGSKHLPNGVYTMPASKGESVSAILSEEAVKDLPDVDVYVGTDDVYMDSDDLVSARMDAPSGWSREQTSTYGGRPARIEWTNEETAYTVAETLNPASGERDGKLDLRRGLDNSIVAISENWGDIQKEIDADQPEYIKKLQKAEATNVVQSLDKEREKVKVKYDKSGRGKTPPREASFGKNWVKHENGQWYEYNLGRNYDVSEEEMQKAAKDAAGDYNPPEDSEFGRWGQNRETGKWKEWDEPSEEYSNYRAKYKKRLNSEYTKLRRLQEAQKAGLLNYGPNTPSAPEAPEAVGEIKRISGVEKIDRLKEIDDAIVANSPISFMYNDKERTGRPIKMYDNKAKGTTNVVVESLDGKEQKTFTVDKMDPMPRSDADGGGEKPPTDVIAPASTPDEGPRKVTGATAAENIAQVQDAIDAGEEISFMYNGKERTITPEGLWENGKTGTTNVYGMDKDAGDKRTYTVEKMQAVPEAKTIKEPTGSNTQAIKPGDLESMKSQVQSAIDSGKNIAFNYNDKTRVFTPENIYFNSKNSNTNVAGYSHTDGEERTFAIDNMSPPRDSRPTEQERKDGILRIDRIPQPWSGQMDTEETRKQRKIEADIARKSGDPRYRFDKDGFISGKTMNWLDGIDETEAVDYMAPGGPGEPPTGGPDSGGPTPLSDAPVPELLDQIQDAINNGGAITFTYNGKERTVRPQRTYFNPKNGSTNLVGFSEGDGEDRTFSIDKIEFPFVAPEERDDASQSFFEEEFDSMYDVPEGAYKPNIFEMYEPKGRQGQESANYTDDPEMLATRFSSRQLVLALNEALLPSDDNERATGQGFLPFDSGDESVPAEAIYEAVQYSGFNGDAVLARIYDSGLDPALGESNIDRANQRAQDMFLEPSSSPLRNELPATSRSEEMLRAKQDSANIAKASRVESLKDDLENYEETNNSLLTVASEMAEAIKARNRSELYSDLFIAFYNLSTGSEEEKQAFRGFWGMLMSLDGGDSPESFEESMDLQGEYEGWRSGLIAELEYRYDGDTSLAEAAYNELIDNYGGYPEFVKSREDIINGKADLDSATTGAAFYRLIKATSSLNSKPLYRVIHIENDDKLVEMYSTEGARFYLDPRSWTHTTLGDGSLESQFFMAGRGTRIIFEALPGDIDAFDASPVSPFAAEGEHFAYGDLEVVSVRRNKSRIGGPTDEIVVQVRKAPPEAPEVERVGQAAPEAGSPPSGGWPPKTKTYAGIEGWTKTAAGTGSNPGGFYRDKNGNEYYVKIPKSQSHADNETLAALLYEALGVPAAETSYGDDNGELRLVSPIVPGSNPDGFFDHYESDDAAYLDQIRDHFVIDAWLANYDVIGYLHDGSTNIISDSNGDPIRVDPGASLMWRAQGKAKGDDRFSYDDSDLDSMRDQDINPQAASVFAKTTDAQLQNAAMRLRDLTPSMIDQIVDANVVSESDRKVLKDKLKARRRAILDRFNIPEGIDDPEMFPDPVPLTESMGYAAQDLLPGDVTASDSFVIDKVFQDENTPSGKVSIQGYYPGHEMQRKEWNAGTVIEVSRGGTQPPMGDQPALHRPDKPRKPSSGAFNGEMQKLLSGVDNWEEAADVIRSTEIIYFDYETTGLSTTPGDGELNRPVQIGAVKVYDGEVLERINIYMNPEFRLSQWSRDNLKQENGEAVTDEWLATQPSMLEAHQQFLDFVGERPILGGQYIPFDLEVLQRTLSEQGLELDIAGTIDSKDIAAGSLPKWSVKSPEGPMQVGKDGKRRSSNSLGPVAEYLGVELNNWHRADADAEASADIVDAMLTRAISNPDTPTKLLDTDGSFEAQRIKQAEYEAELAQYKSDLAEYEMSKAIAAAWNCGGSGITASVGENGPCSVPSVDQLIKSVDPSAIDSVDPDGVALGDPASPSSMADVADVDSPEGDGKNVRDPYADEPFPPTGEQRDIVDAIFTGDDVKVLALAGTGKTSTLKLVAKQFKKKMPKKRVIYIAFNKSIQNEAQATMPSNVESRTADSISYRAMPKEITSKMGSKSAIFTAKAIGSHFGIFSYAVATGDTDRPREELSQFEIIRGLKKAITKYTNSADDEIGPQHFDDFEADDQLIAWANAMWADLKSPKGVLALSNSHITKMWALTRPDLSQTSSGLSYPADVVFFDEAQDINPVLGKVIADQKIQKIYVGDSNQAIYAFRGAVDELDRVEVVRVLPLTKSWRFGPQIAGIANRFLTLLGSKQRITGAGPQGEIVPRGSMTDAEAVLVRTNIGAIKEISFELGNGRSVGVSKNFKDDLDSLSRSANWLKNGGAKPGKIHEEIASFSSWAELEKAIADEETSRKLGTFLELIDEVGFAGLDEMLSRLKIYKSSEDGLGASPSATAKESLPELTVDSARTTSKGTIADGVDYTIVGDMIVLSGSKTFDNKDIFKKNGFKWDGEKKRWAKSIPSDTNRLAALSKLREAITGGYKDSDEDKDANRIDVVITTAHTAKGLEWNRVRIGDDYWGPKMDPLTGGKMMPKPEELRLAYVAVTRAKKTLDPGSLEWIFLETSESDESPDAPKAVSPEADAGDITPPPPPTDDTAVATPDPEPEPEPELAPEPEAKEGLSGIAESPDAFDPLDETPPYTGPVQDVDVINDEASVVQATYEGFEKDYEAAVDSLNADLVFLREEGNSKEKKAARELQRAKDVIDKLNNGEISRAEAIEQLKALEAEALERAKKSSGTEERVLNEQINDDIAEVRRVLDATASTGILVSKHYPPEGSGKGFDKNGVFIKIGDRVRDKWGYAGTVTRYNSSGGWNNIYIKKDVDGRDPNKIDPKRWGPGYIDSKGTGSVTVIKEGEDNSPYIPVPGKESKGPQKLDEQLASLKFNKDSGDTGGDGLGVRPFMGPEDDDSGGAAGEPEAGTTEALRENVEARSEADVWSGDEETRTDTPKGEAPSGATAEAPELAAEIGDEISSPDGEQNSLALRTPDDEILFSLITGGGSTDSGVELNRIWVDHLEQYTEGDGPADKFIKIVTDLLASLSSREQLIDISDKDILKELIDNKLMKVVKPNAENPDGTYEASPLLTNILHGISGFTSGVFYSTKDEKEAKEIIDRMDRETFFANGGGYVDELPTEYGSDPPERTVKEFWKNFATILSNPKVLSQPSPEDRELLASAAGMLLRALSVASPLEGTFARVLHFMEDIEDESHPLHYMLNVGQEVQLRPTSWMQRDEETDIADLREDGLFEHGFFGTQEGALGDVLFTVTNPRGLNARPLPNDYGETETILSGGRYKVIKVEKKEINGSPYTHITLEDVSRKKVPEGSEAPEAEAPELDNEPVKLRFSRIVLASVPKEIDELLGKGTLNAEQVFVSKEPVQTTTDFDTVQKRAIEGKDPVLVRILVSEGTTVAVSGKPKPVEIPEALAKVAKDRDALFELLSESHDPYAGLAFSLPAGLKFEVLRAKKVKGPLVFAEDGTGDGTPSYSYTEVTLSVGNFPVDSNPADQAPELSSVDEADVNAAKVDPDWQIDTPEWEFESVMSDLYKQENFTFADPETGEMREELREESIGIKSYQFDDFYSINGFLRTGAGGIDRPLASVVANIDRLDKAMEKAPKLAKDTVFYRQVSEDVFEILDALEVGGLYTDEAFTSTSIDDNIPLDYLQYEIFAPAGTTGVYVQGYLGWQESDYEEEQEFLLDRNTTFRVVAKTNDSDGKLQSIRFVVVEQSKPDISDVVEQRVPKAPEADNSPEVTTKLGTDISTPDVSQPGVKAAPDHTPQDYELIKKMIAEGPQAIGSEMTANWIKHIEEFRARRDADPDAEDDDAERGIDFVEKYREDRKDELREDTEGDEFIQNLMYGIDMFVQTGPQGADDPYYDTSFKDLTGGSEFSRSYQDLIAPSRESVRSFYIDIARYYENPDLIDQELTPASAFLRAIRSARKKDAGFERVLSFNMKISDPEHPLHRLSTIGQEIDLRPSSWTQEGNIGSLEAVVDDYYGDWEKDLEKRKKILDNATSIILSIKNTNALNITSLGIPEEKESILSNGRYKVVGIERVEVPLDNDSDMYMPAVKITLEQIESPKAKEADTPKEPEVQVSPSSEPAPIDDKDVAPEVVPEPAKEKISKPVKEKDGTWVGEIPYEELQKMKRTGGKPDKLPFFMQMGDDPGDGYFWSSSGNRFWGRYGAAGTLVRYRDPDTGEYRYLLGKRATWISAGGGKWGIPGGAHKDLEASEEPTTTAFAELKEELGVDLGGTTDDPVDGPGIVSEFHFSDLDPDWSYDTFIVDVDKSLANSATISDSETSEIGFFTLDEIKEMADNGELHPAFASSIDDIIDLAKGSESKSKPEVTQNFDTSDVENIPSINSTLDTLRGSVAARADVLVDGDDIEDTRVTFTKETRVDGAGIVARLKLTKWAGDRQLAIVDESADWAHDTEANAIAFEDKKLDPYTGRAVVDQSGNRGGAFDDDILADMSTEFGTRHTYTDPDGRFTIEFYETDKDNPILVGFADTDRFPKFNAVNNKVEIKFADDEPSEEVIKEALKIAGVRNPGPARPEDIKTLIENRLLSVFAGFTDADTNISDEKQRAQELDEIARSWGLTSDNVEVSINADGLLDMKIPESAAAYIVQQTKIKGFNHSLTIKQDLSRGGGNPADSAEKIFNLLFTNDAEPTLSGLLSTQERFDSGLQVPGMSSDTDMTTGGADYVYLQITDISESRTADDPLKINNEDTAVMFFDPIETMRNLAIWANFLDQFGQRKHDNVIKNIRSGGYEFMVKRHLGFEGLQSMVVSVDVRNALLKKFHDKKITEINGIPVNDFLKIFNGFIDKNEWKPGEDLLDRNDLTDQIVEKTISKTVAPPNADYLKYIPSRDGAVILSEVYHGLQRFGTVSADEPILLFMEKKTGKIIAYDPIEQRLEVHSPRTSRISRLSAASVKKLNEMIDSGKINDIAISFGTYGVAGVDLQSAARKQVYRIEYGKILEELSTATTSSKIKSLLLKLVNLERANIPLDVRDGISKILNGPKYFDNWPWLNFKSIPIEVINERVPDIFRSPDLKDKDNIFWTGQ